MQAFQLSEFIAPPPAPVSVVLGFELTGKRGDFQNLALALELDVSNFIQAKHSSDEGFRRLWSHLKELSADERTSDLYRRLRGHLDRLEVWEGSTRAYIARSKAPQLELRPGLGPELADIVLTARKQHDKMLEAMEQYAQRLQQVRTRLESYLATWSPRDWRELSSRKADQLEGHLDQIELEDSD